MTLRWFLVAFTAVLLLFFYVWQQNFQTQLGYRVAELKGECEKWELANESLRLRINTYVSLDQLDAVGKRAKLTVPDDKRVIYLNR